MCKLPLENIKTKTRKNYLNKDNIQNKELAQVTGPKVENLKRKIFNKRH